jgi:hypothetical protein
VAGEPWSVGLDDARVVPSSVPPPGVVGAVPVEVAAELVVVVVCGAVVVRGFAPCVVPEVARGLAPAGPGVLPDVARGAAALLELDALGVGEAFGDGLGDGFGDGLGAGADAAGGAELGAPPLPNAKPMTVPGAGL